MPFPEFDKKDRQVEAPDYSPEELEYRGRLIKEMDRARRDREQNHDEFDGQTYTQYYESNAKAANAYIKPKVNRKDIRIVTGTTLNKEEALLSALLNFNLGPNITAYDEENDEIRELGETMESLIDKSRLIERPDYDVKRPVVYKEALDQGTVFVEETWVEWEDIRKELDKGFKWSDGAKMKKVWKKRDSKIKGECRTNVLSGPNVYLGNIKEFYMEFQPFIFTRQYMSIEEAYLIFGQWDRWENVPHKMKPFNDQRENITHRDWSLLEIEPGFAEILVHQSQPRNELMIMVNGVMMLPIEFPLSAMTGKNMYTIAKGDVNPISRFFAYSKSIPSKTKVDQQMLDELYRLMIQKTQRSFYPSMANNTGRKLSTRIFDPGNLTDDIDVNRLQPLLDPTGVSQSEFNMVQFIKNMIDQKSVSAQFEGQTTPGSQTATEIAELKKQGMQKLGLSIWGITNLEKKMAWLRLHNILRYWTEAQDTRVNKATEELESTFKKVSVDADFDDGSGGTRIIEFSEEEFSPSQVLGEEKVLERRMGKSVRKTYLNPKLLRDLEINWEIRIEPTEKQSDALDRAQFEESLGKIFQIFAPAGKLPNMDYLATVWAQKAKLDPDKVWQQEQQPQLPGPGGPGGGPSQQLAQGVRPPPANPSNQGSTSATALANA